MPSQYASRGEIGLSGTVCKEGCCIQGVYTCGGYNQSELSVQSQEREVTMARILDQNMVDVHLRKAKKYIVQGEFYKSKYKTHRKETYKRMFIIAAQDAEEQLHMAQLYIVEDNEEDNEQLSLQLAKTIYRKS